MEARAGTDNNLGRLTRVMQIDAPFIIINSKIAKDGFAMAGTLSFEDDPIQVDISPDLGTRYTFEAITLESSFGIEMPGSGKDEGTDSHTEGSASKKSSAFGVEPTIGIKTQIRLRPTKWDPDLKLVSNFNYNLVTQEISAAGSMVDIWKNPLGMDNLFDKDIVSFTNTAVSMGYIPGSPTPTSIGFNLDEAKFFHLTFGTAITVAPAKKSVAMKGHRDKMSMNDLTRILRDGFGLNLPDVFPDDINIKDVVILYSPNGGEIGEFKLEQGFALKGNAKLLGAAEAKIDFFANFNEGFYLDYKFDAGLKQALMNEIRKVKPLAPAMDKVLSTFQLRKVYTHLEAGMDLKMSGKTHVKFEVFGHAHEFKMQATLDPEAIIDAIIDKVMEQNKMMEIAGNVAGTVGGASKKAFGIASDAWNDASKFIGSASRHLTHSKSECDNNCVPDLARKMYRPLLAGSNEAVLAFYRYIYPELTMIEGSNRAETMERRKKLIWNEWSKLADKIDRDWHKIIYDDTYISFYLKPSSASNGGEIYRRHVREQRDKHKKFRKLLYTKLMTDKSDLPSLLLYEGAAGYGEFYEMNVNGGLGTKVASTDGWRTTWSEIEYYNSGSKEMVLFYQQAGGGSAEMYQVKSDGTMGGRVASTSGWKSTWSDIEYYRAGGKDMMLFYEQAGGGSAEMYQIKSDGTLGSRVATTKEWKATWSDIEYYRAGDQDMMLFYEKSGGGSAEMYQIKSDGTLGSRVAATKGWRATWSDIEYYNMGGKDMIMFYEKSSGTAEVYSVASSGGLGGRVMQIDNLGKKWDDIEPGNMQNIEAQVDWLSKNWERLSANVSLSSLLFYESESGSGEFYSINSNGGLGAQFGSTKSWRTTWSDIEYYRADGKGMVLFYQQSGGGSAEMYRMEAYGNLGGRIAATKDWRSTWSEIEYYSADGKDMMLFYQQAGGGSAAMYQIKSDGTLGKRVAVTDRWKATWSDIEYYRAGDKDMMLFYEQAGGGSAEMYEIKSDGTLGSRVAATKNWKATWSDIEYFRAGGKDLMLFYESSTGSAEIYEIAASGGLGSRVMKINNWRKTWSDIEATFD